MDGQYRSWSAANARELIERWRLSGLTRAAFCRREGVAMSSFDLWRRRLGEASGVAAVAASGRAVERHDLVEVVVQDSVARGVSGEYFEIAVGDEVSLRVPLSAGAATVVSIINALRRP